MTWRVNPVQLQEFGRGRRVECVGRMGSAVVRACGRVRAFKTRGARELLVSINHSKKQYKQRGGENYSQLNSTRSSSPLLSLVSLCVFTLLCHHFTALQ